MRSAETAIYDWRVPWFGIVALEPVLMMIQASLGPWRLIADSTSSPTLASIAVSDDGAFPTSTLLRSIGINSPRQ